MKLEDYGKIECLYGPPPVYFDLDVENMPLCSHLKAKLAKGGEYHRRVQRLIKNPSYTFKAIRRQLHIYKDGKKVLILTGKSGIKELAK